VYSEKLLMMDRGTASRIRMELQFHPDPAHKLSANLYDIQVHPDPACKLSANLYDIYHCCVYSEKLLMMDRGTV
jgi:hypothetical protein